MTINVAVVTSEALILGCDSIASITGYFVNPFECPSERFGALTGSVEKQLAAARNFPEDCGRSHGGDASASARCGGGPLP
jgi:hypothetical protein